MLDPARLSQAANGDQFYSYTALFIVTAWTGTPRPDGVEIAEAQWVVPGQWPPLTRLGEEARRLVEGD